MGVSFKGRARKAVKYQEESETDSESNNLMHNFEMMCFVIP